jgi:hypothetical protein
MAINEVLSVSIPTFNRALDVIARIEELEAQLNESTALHIYDNNSTGVEVSLIEARISNSIAQKYIFLHKNRVNIGADANILRCIEDTPSNWVWILGDDDQIAPNAICDLLKLIRGLPSDVAAIKCSSECGAVDGEFFLDASNKLNNIQHDFLANFLFISSTIVKRDKVQSLIGEYSAIPSMCSHLVLMLNMINSGYRILFTPIRITQYVAPGGWSRLDLDANFFRGLYKVKNPERTENSNDIRIMYSCQPLTSFRTFLHAVSDVVFKKKVQIRHVLLNNYVLRLVKNYSIQYFIYLSVLLILFNLIFLVIKPLSIRKSMK